MGFSPSEWQGESIEQRVRQARRYAAIIGLYEAIDRHLAGEHREIVRRQISWFSMARAKLEESVGDRQAMRRSLWKALRAQPRAAGTLLPALLGSYRRAQSQERTQP